MEVLYHMLSGVQKHKEILPIATAIYRMLLEMVFYERKCGRQRSVMFLSYNVVLPGSGNVNVSGGGGTTAIFSL